uniref:Monocarboxylate transporter 9 n=1 Tax=Denticeps clupeoides TaxID=299321 RepID=A0AAY4EW28_9TELE
MMKCFKRQVLKNEDTAFLNVDKTKEMVVDFRKQRRDRSPLNINRPGPVCSACVDSFGARPVTIFSGVMVAGGMMLSAFAPNISFLIFSYGIVCGLGCGLVYAATLTITCQYFEKRRGLALGIVTTGTSVGGFLYATLQNELISLYGLEGCLLIVGALALNLMPCAGPMRPLHLPGYYLKQKAALEEKEAPLYQKPTAVVIGPEDSVDIKAAPGTAEKVTVMEVVIASEAKVVLDFNGAVEQRYSSLWSAVVQVIKKKLLPYRTYMHQSAEFLHDRVFTTLCISMLLFTLGAFPPVLFMEDVAQSEGLIDDIALIPLVSIVAITTGIGKLVLGVMADIRWINSLMLYSLTMVGSGMALLFIPVCKSYVGLQVLSGVVGFFSGNWSLTSYITTKIVGIEKLGQAHGILMCFGGFGITLGPPVVGWFFDWTQSYDLAFFFSGGCVLLGGICLFLVTLPCWTEKPVSSNQPGVQWPSECDQVASEA